MSGWTSSSERTRSTGLVVLFILGALCITTRSMPVLAADSGPGAGWVKANAIRGGCVTVQDNGFTVQICNSYLVPGGSALFEYAPAAESYGRGAGPGSDHGGYRTAVARQSCANGQLAAGTWHQGASWTLSYRRVAYEPETLRPIYTTYWTMVSGSRHWAFWHNDVCLTDPSWQAETPIPVPPTLDPSLPTADPNAPTSTPTIAVPIGSTPTPTDSILPLPTATATSSPCQATITDPASFPPIGIDLVQLDASGLSQAAVPGMRSVDVLRQKDNGDRIGYTFDDRASWSGSPVVTVPGQPLRVIFRFDALRGAGYVGLTNAHRRVLFGIRDLTSGRDVTRVFAETSKPRRDSERALRIVDGSPDVNRRSTDAQGLYGITWGMEQTDERGRITWVAGPNGNAWSGLFVGSDLVPTWNPQAFYPRDALYHAVPQYATFVPEAGHSYEIYTIAGQGACSWTDGSHAVTVRIATGGGPNLQLRKQAPAYAMAGRALSYLLTVRNTGTVVAPAVTVTDPLAGPLGYLSSDPAPPLRPATDASGTVRWSLGDLAPGELRSIFLMVNVPDGATADLTNRACAATTVPETILTDNCSDVITPIIPPPQVSADLSIRFMSAYDDRLKGPVPDTAVRQTTGLTLNWPTGETLFWTPHLNLRPTVSPRPDLLVYRSEILGWSYQTITTTGGLRQSATDPDSNGIGGCRARDVPTIAVALPGCVYAYRNAPTADQMRQQARHTFSGVLTVAPRTAAYQFLLKPVRSPWLGFTVLVRHQAIDAVTGTVIYEEFEEITRSLNVRLLLLRDIE